MKYLDIDPRIKKTASEIVFGASVIEGVPYTICLKIGQKEIFVNVEAYLNPDGMTNYLVEISPDGYETIRKNFRDTPQAIRFLARNIANLESRK